MPGGRRQRARRSHASERLRAPNGTPQAFEIDLGDLAQRLVVDFLRGKQVAKAAQPDRLKPITDRAGGGGVSTGPVLVGMGSPDFVVTNDDIIFYGSAGRNATCP